MVPKCMYDHMLPPPLEMFSLVLPSSEFSSLLLLNCPIRLMMEPTACIQPPITCINSASEGSFFQIWILIVFHVLLFVCIFILYFLVFILTAIFKFSNSTYRLHRIPNRLQQISRNIEGLLRFIRIFECPRHSGTPPNA